jgi:hypothetical protein
MVPIILDSSSISLTSEQCMEFVDRAERFRTKEFAAPFEAPRKGFCLFFTLRIADLFS